MKKILIYTLVTLPYIALAQGLKIDSPTPGLGSNAWDFIAIVIKILTWFVIPAITVVIIWAGFNMATAGGDTKKIKASKDMLLGAIIGAVVLFSAQMIVDIVRKTGEDILK